MLKHLNLIFIGINKTIYLKWRNDFNAVQCGEVATVQLVFSKF